MLCDYGAFRDLQRHRPLTIEWQRLTTEHGFETPSQIDEAGLRSDWDRVMEASSRMERELLDTGLQDVAQYAVSMAYRIPGSSGVPTAWSLAASVSASFTAASSFRSFCM